MLPWVVSDGCCLQDNDAQVDKPMKNRHLFYGSANDHSVLILSFNLNGQLTEKTLILIYYHIQGPNINV